MSVGAAAHKTALAMVSAETPSKSPKRARAPTPSVPRWKAEEEERLRALVKELGTKGTWSTIAERLETGRSKSAVEQHWAILTGKRKPSTPKKAAGVGSSAAPQVAPKADAAADSRFWQSIRIYFACVGGLFTLLAVILRYAPEAEADVCDEVGVSSFLGSNKTQGVIDLWKCATAYQKSNSLFVLGMFELTYIGLKMFAIPAAFTLCVLSGACARRGLAASSWPQRTCVLPPCTRRGNLSHLASAAPHGRGRGRRQLVLLPAFRRDRAAGAAPGRCSHPPPRPAAPDAACLRADRRAIVRGQAHNAAGARRGGAGSHAPLQFLPAVLAPPQSPQSPPT